jgi:hypothetical protein
MYCFGSTLNRVGRRVHVVKDLDAVFLGHASVYHYLLQLIEGLAFHRLSCVESGDKLSFHPLQLPCFLFILIDQLPLLHGLEFVFILYFSRA